MRRQNPGGALYIERDYPGTPEITDEEREYATRYIQRRAPDAPELLAILGLTEDT